MNTPFLSVLQLARKILAVVGVVLLLAIGQHAFSQAFDKSVVRGTPRPVSKVQWSALFTY